MAESEKSLEELLTEINETLKTRPSLMRIEVYADGKKYNISISGVSKVTGRLREKQTTPEDVLDRIKSSIPEYYLSSAIIKGPRDTSYITLIPKPQAQG